MRPVLMEALILLAVVIVIVVVACCKVSGDCAREEECDPCYDCLRWEECNGVDENCPRRGDGQKEE